MADQILRQGRIWVATDGTARSNFSVGNRGGWYPRETLKCDRTAAKETRELCEYSTQMSQTKKWDAENRRNGGQTPSPS